MLKVEIGLDRKCLQYFKTVVNNGFLIFSPNSLSVYYYNNVLNHSNPLFTLVFTIRTVKTKVYFTDITRQKFAYQILMNC